MLMLSGPLFAYGIASLPMVLFSGCAGVADVAVAVDADVAVAIAVDVAVDVVAVVGFCVGVLVVGAAVCVGADVRCWCH